jgi:cell division protein ZipA
MAELRWILLGAGLALIAGLYLWGTRAGRRSAATERSRAVVYEPPHVDFPEPAHLEPEIGFDDIEERESLARADAALDRYDEVPETLDESGRWRREPKLGHPVGTAEETEASLEDAPLEDALLEGEFPAGTEPEVAEPDLEPDQGTPAVEPVDEESQTSVAARAQRIVAFRVTAPLPSRFEGSLLHEAILAEGFEFGRYDIFHRLDSAGRPLISLANLREPGTFEPSTMAGAAFPGVTVFAVLPGPVTGQRALDELVSAGRGLAGRLGGILQDDRGAPLGAQRVAQLREELMEFDRGRAPRPAH